MAGHDGDWFLARAREYKAKGQLHNACFYYERGPQPDFSVELHERLATDKLFDESQNLQPPDLPGKGKTVDLPAERPLTS